MRCVCWKQHCSAKSKCRICLLYKIPPFIFAQPSWYVYWKYFSMFCFNLTVCLYTGVMPVLLFTTSHVRLFLLQLMISSPWSGKHETVTRRWSNIKPASCQRPGFSEELVHSWPHVRQNKTMTVFESWRGIKCVFTHVTVLSYHNCLMYNPENT